MANAILFDAHPSAETLIATTGTLKNLANAAIAVSAATYQPLRRAVRGEKGIK